MHKGFPLFSLRESLCLLSATLCNSFHPNLSAQLKRISLNALWLFLARALSQGLMLLLTLLAQPLIQLLFGTGYTPAVSALPSGSMATPTTPSSSTWMKAMRPLVANVNNEL